MKRPPAPGRGGAAAEQGQEQRHEKEERRALITASLSRVRRRRERACCRRMGCCRKWCRTCGQSLAKFLLLWINFVDLVCGVAAVGLGVYLRIEGGSSPVMDKIVLISLSLGGVFLLSAILGFIGVIFNECGCVLRVSAFLALPLAVLEFAAGAGTATMKPHLLRYLKNNAKDVDEELIASWYFALVGALFGAAVFELLRYKLTLSLKRSLSADVDDLHRSLMADADDARRRGAEASEDRRERYDKYREHFRNKYARDDDLEAVREESTASEPVVNEPVAKPPAKPWFEGL